MWCCNTDEDQECPVLIKRATGVNGKDNLKSDLNMFTFSGKVKQEEEGFAEEDTSEQGISPLEPFQVKREVAPPVMDDDEDTILNDDPEIQLKPFTSVLEDSSTLDAFDDLMPYDPALGDNNNVAGVDEDMGVDGLCAHGKEETLDKRGPPGTVMKSGKEDSNLPATGYFRCLGVNHRKKGCPLEAEEQVTSLLQLEAGKKQLAKEEPTEAKPAEEVGTMAVDPLPTGEVPAKSKFKPWGRIKFLRAEKEKSVSRPRRSCHLNSLPPSFMSAASVASLQEPAPTETGEIQGSALVKRQRRRKAAHLVWTKVKKRPRIALAAPVSASEEEPVEPPHLLSSKAPVDVLTMKKKCQQTQPSVWLHRTKKKRRKATVATYTVPHLEEPMESPPSLKMEEPAGIEPVKRRRRRRAQSVLLKRSKRKRLAVAVVDCAPALEEGPMEHPPLLEIEEAPVSTPVKQRRKRRTCCVLMPKKKRRKLETVAAVATLPPAEEVPTEPPKKGRKKSLAKPPPPARKAGRPPKNHWRRKLTLSSDTRVETSAETRTLVVPRMKRRVASATAPFIPASPVPNPVKEEASSSSSQPFPSSSSHANSTSCCCRHHHQQTPGHGQGVAASVSAVFAQLFDEEIRQLADGKGYINMTLDIYKRDTPSRDAPTSCGTPDWSRDTRSSAAGSTSPAVVPEGPAKDDAGAGSSQNSLSILSDVDLCMLLKGRILAQVHLAPELRESLAEGLEQVQKVLMSQQPSPSPQPSSDSEDDGLLED